MNSARYLQSEASDEEIEEQRFRSLVLHGNNDEDPYLTPRSVVSGQNTMRRTIGVICTAVFIASAMVGVFVVRPGMMKDHAATANVARSESKVAEYMHSYLLNIRHCDVDAMVSSFSPNGELVFRSKGMIETFTTPADVQQGLRILYKAVEDAGCRLPEKQGSSSLADSSTLSWGCPGKLTACLFTAFETQDPMHYWSVAKMSVDLDASCPGHSTKDPLRAEEY